MGNVSDRSNVRYFLSTDLLLSAGIMFIADRLLCALHHPAGDDPQT